MPVKPIQKWTAAEVREALLPPLAKATLKELRTVGAYLDKLEQTFTRELADHQAERSRYLDSDPSNPVAMEVLAGWFSKSTLTDIENAKNKIFVIGQARRLVARRLAKLEVDEG